MPKTDREDMAHDKPIAAAGVIFAAMFLLGLIDNLVVVIARDLGLWQFHFMRAGLAEAMMVTLSAFGLIRLIPTRRWAVALRGGLAGLSMLIYFGCLAFMPIGQVAAGRFTAPIWVMLLGAEFLNQPIGLPRIMAALAGFADVMLVLNPFQNGLTPIALIPVTAGFFYAIGGIATRQWCDAESPFSMLLYFFLSLALFGLIGTGGMTAIPHHVPTGVEGFILRGLTWPGAQTLGLIVIQAVGQ